MTTVISSSPRSDDPLRPATAGDEELRYEALVEEGHQSSARKRYSDAFDRIKELLPDERELLIQLDAAHGELLCDVRDRAIDNAVITIVDRASWPSFDRVWVTRRAEPDAVPLEPRSFGSLRERVDELAERIEALASDLAPETDG